jgi:hypothetical protein
MAKDLAELSSWWGDAQNDGFISNTAKRLVLYAPDLPAWHYISSSWDNVLHFPSEAGSGLQEVDYSQIINTICNSI